MTTLANGVRVVVFRLPQLATAAVSVFVRSGSQHESARLNGISHFIEHMAFKGTRSRDCQQINLDAERLGAEVNAHTDKNHTAFHMRGLARDAGAFVRMLGDIVRHSTFPEAELERERQVILHEFTEDEDDALSTAFKLFDKACYGEHPLARPVIGSRANIQRFTRADAGGLRAAAVHRRQHRRRRRRQRRCRRGRRRGGARRSATCRAAATTASRRPTTWAASASRRMSGCSQAHVVLGFPIPGLLGEYHARRRRRGAVRRRHELAAARPDPRAARPGLPRRLLGRRDGPVRPVRDRGVDRPRAPRRVLRRGHPAAAANTSTATDPVGLERARNQILVRSLCAQEVPSQRLEVAALDLFAFGRVRSRDELMAGIAAVDAERGARGVRAHARRRRRRGAGRQDPPGSGGTARPADGPARQLNLCRVAGRARHGPASGRGALGA